MIDDLSAKDARIKELERDLASHAGALTNCGNVCRDLNSRFTYLLNSKRIAPWLRKEIASALRGYP